MCFSSASVPLVPSKCLAEHVKGQFRPYRSNALLDVGFLVSYNFHHVGRHFSLLSYCKKSCHECFSILGTQGSATTEFNAGCSVMCVMQIRVLLLCLSGSGSGSGTSSVYDRYFQQCRNGSVGVLLRVYQMMLFLPLN